MIFVTTDSASAGQEPCEILEQYAEAGIEVITVCVEVDAHNGACPQNLTMKIETVDSMSKAATKFEETLDGSCSQYSG